MRAGERGTAHIARRRGATLRAFLGLLRQLLFDHRVVFLLEFMIFVEGGGKLMVGDPRDGAQSGGGGEPPEVTGELGEDKKKDLREHMRSSCAKWN